MKSQKYDMQYKVILNSPVVIGNLSSGYRGITISSNGVVASHVGRRAISRYAQGTPVAALHCSFLLRAAALLTRSVHFLGHLANAIFIFFPNRKIPQGTKL